MPLLHFLSIDPNKCYAQRETSIFSIDRRTDTETGPALAHSPMSNDELICLTYSFWSHVQRPELSNPPSHIVLLWSTDQPCALRLRLTCRSWKTQKNMLFRNAIFEQFPFFKYISFSLINTQALRQQLCSLCLSCWRNLTWTNQPQFIALQLVAVEIACAAFPRPLKLLFASDQALDVTNGGLRFPMKNEEY